MRTQSLFSSFDRNALAAAGKFADRAGAIDESLLITLLEEGPGLSRDATMRRTCSAERRAASSDPLVPLAPLISALSTMAFRDDLTGLYNRRGFSMLGEARLDQWAGSGRHATLFYFDVDRLKQVNDSGGHSVGDALLFQVGRVLSATFRRADVLGRLGGDEFAVLASAENAAGIRSVTERLQRSLQRANQRRTLHPIELSFGTADYRPSRPVTLGRLLVDADRRMYENKRSAISRSGIGR